jgi:hypothetical protein
MFITYNQTFYDLNSKRQYCLALPVRNFPLELIADIKMSVPNNSSIPIFKSVFIKNESVRLLFTVKEDGIESLVASFTNDERSWMQPGEMYQLSSIVDGYSGLVVFGEGLRQDCSFLSDENDPAFLAEDCLTRFRHPGISHVGVACTNIALSGEVVISGTDLVLTTSAQELPDGQHKSLPNVDKGLFLDMVNSDDNKTNNPTLQITDGLLFDLVSSKMIQSDNPIIRVANGINQYGGMEGERYAIFSVAGVTPDENGVITMEFKDHFILSGVVDDLEEENTGETIKANGLAIYTDVALTDVCGSFEGDNSDPSLYLPGQMGVSTIKP